MEVLFSCFFPRDVVTCSRQPDEFLLLSFVSSIFLRCVNSSRVFSETDDDPNFLDIQITNKVSSSFWTYSNLNLKIAVFRLFRCHHSGYILVTVFCKSVSCRCFCDAKLHLCSTCNSKCHEHGYGDIFSILEQLPNCTLAATSPWFRA